MQVKKKTIAYCFTDTSQNKLNPPGDQKESTAMGEEIKRGQLWFMICDNPVTPEAERTMLSELRQFRLTKNSLDCFKKDSQVH